MPHLKALLFQLRRAFAGDVLANRFPRVLLTGAKEGEACVAEHSAERVAGRNMIEVLTMPGCFVTGK